MIIATFLFYDMMKICCFPFYFGVQETQGIQYTLLENNGILILELAIFFL